MHLRQSRDLQKQRIACKEQPTNEQQVCDLQTAINNKRLMKMTQTRNTTTASDAMFNHKQNTQNSYLFVSNQSPTKHQ